jgi:hypothetical protein
MGNNTSLIDNKPKSLAQIVDFVATNYILTSNFQDLLKLTDKDYCDELIVLTSKVIANHLDSQTIDYLAQRTQAGEVINQMTKDKVIYFKKKELPDLNISNSIQKKRICLGIARFYIKIAHLYSAILTTINPQYVYKDALGLKVKVNLMKKKQIPTGSNPIIERKNICSERIKALNSFDPSMNDINPDLYNINPSFCNMNLNTDDSIKSLSNEPGIFELQQLYYDKYDFNEGKYVGMSEKMKKSYSSDLAQFHKFFTGSDKIPEEIKKFSDIKLRDYMKFPICKDQYKIKSIKGNLKMTLFKKYSDHIKSMIKTSETNQDKLLTIIDKLFVFSINPSTKKRTITIHPSLNEQTLEKITCNTRELIINLYVKCEEDFLKGLEIFEAIVQKQILDTAKKQIDNLEENVEDNIALK